MDSQATVNLDSVVLLDRCLAKAARDYLDGKPIDTEGLRALATAVNQIVMYAKYREDKMTLHSITTACEKLNGVLDR